MSIAWVEREMDQITKGDKTIQKFKMHYPFEMLSVLTSLLTLTISTHCEPQWQWKWLHRRIRVCAAACGLPCFWLCCARSPAAPLRAPAGFCREFLFVSQSDIQMYWLKSLCRFGNCGNLCWNIVFRVIVNDWRFGHWTDWFTSQLIFSQTIHSCFQHSFISNRG